MLSAHQEALAIIQATPKDQKALHLGPPSETADDELPVQGYLRTDMANITATMARNSCFAEHAARVINVYDSPDVDSDTRPLAVLHAILGVPRLTNGTVDETKFHVLISQNCWYPRLTAVHHRVFKIILLVRPHLWSYITQYTLFGKDLGLGQKEELRALVFSESKVQTLLETGRMGDINYDHDIFCFLQSAKDGMAHMKRPKSETSLQYSHRGILDDMEIYLINFHESIGLDPLAVDSTKQILLEQKVAVLNVACFDGNFQKIPTVQHESMRKLFNDYGKELMRVMKSKDPNELISRTLIMQGSLRFSAQRALLTETAEAAKKLNDLLPELFANTKTGKSGDSSSTLTQSDTSVTG